MAEAASQELIVRHADAWRDWLAQHAAGQPGGVWLVLAKKGTTEPTSLGYDQALEEALCQGWIDGQVGRRDEQTYRQRFTPRRVRSPWSLRNVGIATRLIQEERMMPAGFAQVEAAKEDGRWAAAYAGPAAREMPEDLAAALDMCHPAKAMWEVLTSQNRYAITYRLGQAKRPATRQRNLEKFIAMLAAGETVHPQKRKPPAG